MDEGPKTLEQWRSYMVQHLYGNEAPAVQVAALTATDTLIDALSQNYANHLHVPGSLEVIYASVDRIIEKAGRDVTYTSIASTEEGTKETATYDMLQRNQATYPNAPEQFHFVMRTEEDTRGKMILRVTLHDSATDVCIGTAFVWLRPAHNHTVEVTVEPDTTYDAVITASNVGRKTLASERDAIQHAFTHQLVHPAVTKAQMRAWSTRNNAFRQVEQEQIRRVTMAPVFVYSALYDGLYAEAATNAARNVNRNVSRAKLTTAVQLPPAPKPLPTDPIDRAIVEAYQKDRTISQANIGRMTYINLSREQVNRRVQRLRKQGYDVGPEKSAV